MTEHVCNATRACWTATTQAVTQNVQCLSPPITLWITSGFQNVCVSRPDALAASSSSDRAADRHTEAMRSSCCFWRSSCMMSR